MQVVWANNARSVSSRALQNRERDSCNGHVARVCRSLSWNYYPPRGQDANEKENWSATLEPMQMRVQYHSYANYQHFKLPNLLVA